MLSSLADFVAAGCAAAADAISGLFLPAVFFVALGFMFKGRSVFSELGRVLPEVGLTLQIMLLNLFLIPPLLGVGAEMMHGVIAGYGLYIVPPDVMGGLPAVLCILIAVFLGDFIGYWRHRLEHTALLWPSHAVHHSDTEMTWLTLERFHPINRLTTFAVDGAFLLALGLPPYAMVANNLVRHYYGYLIHADLPWTYGPLGRVFVSPAMHRWHHAKDPRFFDTNYATVFSIFDRAFGTFRVPGPCTCALGVTDKTAPTYRRSGRICLLASRLSAHL